MDETGVDLVAEKAKNSSRTINTSSQSLSLFRSEYRKQSENIGLDLCEI